MAIENIITILAVVGSALTIFLNLRKFGDNIKSEAEWRTGVNIDMKNMLDKMSEMLSAQKDNAVLIRELIEARIKLEHEIDKLKNEQTTIWKRADELKAELEKLKKVG